MNILKNLTYKSKAFLFSAFFAAAVILVSFCLIIFGSRKVFNREADSYLLNTADLKTLRFESDLAGQLTLVKQLVKSPVVVNYLKNPYDRTAKKEAYGEFEAYKSSFLGETIFWVSDVEKGFYSDMEYVYTINPEDPDTYWYKMTLHETDVYNFNINYNPELQKTMLWINAVVRDEKQQPVGIAGTGIPLDGLFDNLFLDLRKNTELFLYNTNEEITGSLNQDDIESKLNIKEKLPEIDGQILITDIPVIYSTVKGEYCFYPVNTLDWMMVIHIPYTLLDVLTNNMTLMVLLLLFVTGVIVSIYYVFVMGVIRSMSSVIKSTKESAAEQNEFISSVKATVGSTVKSLEDYGTILDEQSAGIEESESHIETLLQQLRVLDSVRRNSLGNAKALETSSHEGQTHVGDLQKNISEIVECSKRLEEANGLIADVTSQTDLLALNAAIEAAHAGELGAGFAVVARAIRQLAEKSRDQEVVVERVIDDMQKMIHSMVESSEAVHTSFDQIVENSANVNANFEEMSESIQQQNDLGRTIDINLKGITDSVNQSSSSFDAMMVSNRGMAEDVNQAAEKSQSLLKQAEDALKSTGIEK